MFELFTAQQNIWMNLLQHLKISKMNHLKYITRYQVQVPSQLGQEVRLTAF